MCEIASLGSRIMDKGQHANMAEDLRQMQKFEFMYKV